MVEKLDRLKKADSSSVSAHISIQPNWIHRKVTPLALLQCLLTSRSPPNRSIQEKTDGIDGLKKSGSRANLRSREVCVLLQTWCWCLLRSVVSARPGLDLKRQSRPSFDRLSVSVSSQSTLGNALHWFKRLQHTLVKVSSVKAVVIS